MTNSTHKHKWKFVRNLYYGYLGRGNLRVKGLYKCKCGALKHGKRKGPVPTWDDDE